jgi:arylsulfatase A-like enzyme
MNDKRKIVPTLKRLLKILLATALLLSLLWTAWYELYRIPRIGRFADPVQTALARGPAPPDHHYSVTTDLVRQLPQAQFNTPNLAKAAEGLIGAKEARMNPRVAHPLARLVTLGFDRQFEKSYPAIHLPSPASVTYTVEIPQQSRLQGNFGIYWRQTKAARFAVLIDGTEIYSHTEKPLPPLPYNDRGWFYREVVRWWNITMDDTYVRWVPFTIDLAQYGGAKIELEFSVVGETGGLVQAFVGNPQILSKYYGPPTPFIIYIADALNTEEVGAYGSDSELTPVIDKFAQGGVLFENFIAAGNWTQSGIATMFTGKYNPEIYLPTASAGLAITPAVRKMFEHDGPDTLPLAFSRAGYRTIAIGNNPFIKAGSHVGVDFGFDEFIQVSRMHVGTYYIEALVAQTLAAHRDENLLLYIHQNSPNPVDIPPRKFFLQSLLALDDITDFKLWRIVACIRQADFIFGRFIETIAALELDQATVIFTADHGQITGAAHDVQMPFDNNSLRRSRYFHGQTVYEPEIRIPFIVAGPNSAAGTRIVQQVSAISLMPTMLALAEIEPFSALAAPDLSAVIAGEPLPETSGNLAFTHGKSGIAMRVDNHHKYIRYDNPLRKVTRDDDWQLVSVKEELFDLIVDPRESNNLVKSNPQLLQNMRELFDNNVSRFAKVFALNVPADFADLVEISGAKKVIVTGSGRADNIAPGIWSIKPTGELFAAIFPDEEIDRLSVILRKAGHIITAPNLRIGPAFLQPKDDGYLLDFPESFTEPFSRLIPPPPYGVARPHLTPMRFDDFNAAAPSSGGEDAFVKDMLRQWGYVQ